MPQQLPTYKDLLWQIGNAQQEVLRLREENSALRKVLEENGIEYVPQHVYDHLAGAKENCSDVIGIYALTLEGKCHFLCTDFDDKSCEYGYKDDVLAFVGICKKWNVSASIERSRSGNGAHCVDIL